MYYKWIQRILLQWFWVGESYRKRERVCVCDAPLEAMDRSKTKCPMTVPIYSWIQEAFVSMQYNQNKYAIENFTVIKTCSIHCNISWYSLHKQDSFIYSQHMQTINIKSNKNSERASSFLIGPCAIIVSTFYICNSTLYDCTTPTTYK